MAAVKGIWPTRAEIGIYLARFKQIVQRLIFGDEFERNVLERSQIHLVVCRSWIVDTALNPVDRIKIDAVIVLQDAPHPDARRLAVFLHADAFAFEILWRFDAGVLVDEYIAVPEYARGKDRDRDVGKLVAAAHDHVMRKRHFRDIERTRLDHPREDLGRGLDSKIAKRDSLGLEVPL